MNGTPNVPNVRTIVLDAGGRYGLHPTWKPFRGELLYTLFEPEPQEAARLERKYAFRSAEVIVESMALGERSGTVTLNVFRNRAMSSSAVRTPLSPLFKGERAAEVEITDRLSVHATTVDEYCGTHGLQADFLKLDTEGTEADILRGAQNQLTSGILGVRAEVNFDRTFAGKELFGYLHDFMLDRDFYLLNLDYEGRGEYQNEFARIDERYGILVSSDAVWLRRKSYLFESQPAAGCLEARVLKYAAFCFHNFAPDVAVDVLVQGRTVGARYETLAATRLLSHVEALLHSHFYRLKWVPGQSLDRNERVYREIFGHAMKTTHEYMQSLELNPD